MGAGGSKGCIYEISNPKDILIYVPFDKSGSNKNKHEILHIIANMFGQIHKDMQKSSQTGALPPPYTPPRPSAPPEEPLMPSAPLYTPPRPSAPPEEPEEIESLYPSATAYVQPQLYQNPYQSGPNIYLGGGSSFNFVVEPVGNMISPPCLSRISRCKFTLYPIFVFKPKGGKVPVIDIVAANVRAISQKQPTQIKYLVMHDNSIDRQMAKQIIIGSLTNAGVRFDMNQDFIFIKVGSENGKYKIPREDVKQIWDRFNMQNCSSTSANGGYLDGVIGGASE